MKMFDNEGREGADTVCISSVDELTLSAPILVLAPHPDDESLGCGALLAAAFDGEGASVVCVTDGSGSHPGSAQWDKRRLAGERKNELVNAITALGGHEKDVSFLGFEDGSAPHDLPGLRDAVDRLAKLCRTRGIRRVFASSASDAHADHKATALLAQELCREVASVSLLYYPIWSRWAAFQVGGADHVPGNLQFDSTQWRRRKRQAIACHRSQLGRLITDDPGGFAMLPEFVEFFASGDEWFTEADKV